MHYIASQNLKQCAVHDSKLKIEGKLLAIKLLRTLNEEKVMPVKTLVPTGSRESIITRFKSNYLEL